MPGALKHLYELDELAAIRKPLRASLSLDQLPRFVEALEIEQGSTCKVKCCLIPHAVQSNQVNISGTLNTVVQVQCQRCLEAIDLPLDLNLDWRMINIDERVKKGAAQSIESTQLEDAEEVNVGDKPISLLEWIEDELLLALPLFAVHQPKCGDQIAKHIVDDQVTSIPDTIKPFADLKDLLSNNKT